MDNGEGEFAMPPEHEEETKQIQEQCSREIRERLAHLDDKYRYHLDNNMADIGERYKVHAATHIRDRQTDVLRSNKVIREVSRELGSDWKFVFQSLMAGFPMDIINTEIERIERQRPFLQPYKALIRWRDMKGENFNINDLISVLKTCVKDDLAARSLAILHCRDDELMAMSTPSQGIASGISKEIHDGTEGEEQNGGADQQANTGVEGHGDAMYTLDHSVGSRIASGVEQEDDGGLMPANGEGAGYEAGGNPGNQNGDDSCVDGPVGDRNLLQVARKLGKDWFQVGTCLDLPADELDEIKSAEGDSYQAAFRMLWLWRDTASQGGFDTPSVLGDALKSAGRQDLEEVLKD